MKKEDFIKGKWYKNPKWSSQEDFAKYDGDDIVHDSIPFDQFVYQGIYEKGKHFWHSADFCTEATLSEVQQYLPDGHPDKMAAAIPFSQTIFKEGDYVVVTKNSSGWYNGEVNHCYKCIRGDECKGSFLFEEMNRIPFINEKIDGRYATPDEIKEYERVGKPYDVTTLDKVEIEEEKNMKPFPKVGTRVELIKGISGCEALSGCKGVVVDEGHPVSTGLLKLNDGFNVKIEQGYGKGLVGRFNGVWEEIRVELINEVALLEEAKRRCPEGAKFKCVNGNSGENSITVRHDLFRSSKNFGVHQGDYWVVLYDKWAEIIEEAPKESKNPMYRSGMASASDYDIYYENQDDDWDSEVKGKINSLVDLHIPKETSTLDAKIKNIKSVDTDLITPNKIILF